MELYTFIMLFRGSTIISQIEANQLNVAIESWGNYIQTKEIKHLGPQGKSQLNKEIKHIDYITLKSLRNAWIFCFNIKTGLATVNVVKTNTVQDQDSKY